jgi:LysR family hydrogen peroxide-inducible transcriptional activator
MISVAHCKELFKPSSPRIICREMEMHQIRYFLAVSEYLNFRRAAEECHVSAPALTQAIQKLEDEIGGKLFRRERNLTHLTDLGTLIRPHLKRVLFEAQGAKNTAEQFLRLEHAPVKLGVMCTIGPIYFMGFLSDFQAKHPGVELTLIDGTAEKLNELLRNGWLDLAILAQPQPFPDTFQTARLYRERFCVAFPVGHEFQAREMIKMDDAAKKPQLLRVNCEFYPHISMQSQDLGIKIPVVYRSEKEDWIQSMVAAGFGVTFLPEFSVATPGVLSRPLIKPEVIREISLVSIEGRSWPPAVETFTRAVQTYPWPHARLQKGA